jgi:hypothetical protein
VDIKGAGLTTGIALQTQDSNGAVKFSVLDSGAWTHSGAGSVTGNLIASGNIGVIDVTHGALRNRALWLDDNAFVSVGSSTPNSPALNFPQSSNSFCFCAANGFYFNGSASVDAPLFLLRNDGYAGFGIYVSSQVIYNLSFKGSIANTIGVVRNPTANTAGNTLALRGGGASTAATDKNGGALSLLSGIATGTGSSAIILSTASPGTTGTADNNPTEKMRITGAGDVGIGTLTPSEKLDVVGNVKAQQYKLSALNTAPSSATDTGTLGEIRVTADFIYVCTATNTWVRSALTTW